MTGQASSHERALAGMADAPGVHFGVHDEQEPAHEAVGHQHLNDGEDELIAHKITQVRRVSE